MSFLDNKYLHTQISEEINEILTPEYVSNIGKTARLEVHKWLNILTKNDLNKIAHDFYSTPFIDDQIKVFLSSNLKNLRAPTGIHRLVQEEFDLLASKNPNKDFNISVDSMSTRAILRYFRTEMILERFYLLLLNLFPEHVNKPSECLWMWNDVGFVKARIRILYSKIGHDGKYIALFGSSSRHHGYSGSYPKMKVYDIMLTGLMKSFSTHQKDSLPHFFGPSDISDLQKHHQRYYEIMVSDPDYLYSAPENQEEEPYMIDMGVGDIASVFPDGIIKPAFFLDYDYSLMVQQIKSSMSGAKKNCIIL